MRHERLLEILPFNDISRAAPARKFAKTPLRILYNRKVPQEHSHSAFLTSVRTSLALDNPENIRPPVFSLLGNGAAVAGQGSTTDRDCFYQATADQAFMKAKNAGDVDRTTNASTNPEIAAVPQHQDPAPPGPAATNKALSPSNKPERLLPSEPTIKKPSSQELWLLESSISPLPQATPATLFNDEPGCIFTIGRRHYNVLK